MTLEVRPGRERMQAVVSYDSEADAAYIDFAERTPGASVKTVNVNASPIDGNMIIDIDEDGTIIGIELIGVSVLLGLRFALES